MIGLMLGVLEIRVWDGASIFEDIAWHWHGEGEDEGDGEGDVVNGQAQWV